MSRSKELTDENFDNEKDWKQIRRLELRYVIDEVDVLQKNIDDLG